MQTTRVVLGTAIAAVLLTTTPATGLAQSDPSFAVELEAGPVWQSRHDV